MGVANTYPNNQDLRFNSKFRPVGDLVNIHLVVNVHHGKLDIIDRQGILSKINVHLHGSKCPPKKTTGRGFSKYPPLIIKCSVKTYPTRVYLANFTANVST